MNARRRPPCPPLVRVTALVLVCALAATACGRSLVQIRPPFQQKVRSGDGVKVTLASGVLLSGRVTYVDHAILVIRTPKQTLSRSPVETSKFTITVPWDEVSRVRVAGTLDSHKRLISNEEIRVNHRTNHRRNLAVNVGALGGVLSFFLATALQDRVSSPFDPQEGNMAGARLAFWSTWVLGTAASVIAGYQTGAWLDRSIAIDRIELLRAKSALGATSSDTTHP